VQPVVRETRRLRSLLKKRREARKPAISSSNYQRSNESFSENGKKAYGIRQHAKTTEGETKKKRSGGCGAETTRRLETGRRREEGFFYKAKERKEISTFSSATGSQLQLLHHQPMAASGWIFERQKISCVK